MSGSEQTCPILHPTSLSDFIAALTDLLNKLRQQGCTAPTVELKVVGGGIQACACYGLLYVKCGERTVACFEAPEPIIMQ